MPFSDLYLSVGLKRNMSHFANIVRIAKSDNVITQEEIAFLQNVAKRFNIDDDKFSEIIKCPEKFPTIAHLENVERIERFYDLVKMVNADHVIAKEEVSVLRKIATGLAFPIHYVDEIVEWALKIDLDKTDYESFQNQLINLVKIEH